MDSTPKFFIAVIHFPTVNSAYGLLFKDPKDEVLKIGTGMRPRTCSFEDVCKKKKSFVLR